MKKLLLLIIFLSCWTLLPAPIILWHDRAIACPVRRYAKGQDRDAWRKLLASRGLLPPKFNFNTWNYYLNVTIFPFLEVAYTCTLFTAESLGLDKHGYSGFTNQDRYFSARLRVLKESKYIPAVVLGTSDPFTSSGHKFASAIGNGYFCRYYLAATKHFQLGRETLGVHLSYLYNRREDYPLNGVAGGITYNPSFAPHLNVIAEYDSKDFAMGATYLLFNHIHFQFELQRMKYFSGGLCYKIYLK